MVKPRIVIGIDVETDVGSFTPYYEGVKLGVPKLLKLFLEKNIKATFYFTGASARENPEIAKMVIENGHEVGCHSLYHETLGDELFSIPNVKAILPEEVPIRICKATQWVSEACGKTPVSFRCPRLWGSTDVLNILDSLGYVSDASYPMYFYRRQFSPYHPSKENWLEKGDMNILEIPNFADMVMKSNDSPLERDRDQWPLFRTNGSDVFSKKIEKFLDFVQKMNLPPVLCFYFHPWEFVEVKPQYDFGECTVIPNKFITENCGDVALEHLSRLLDYLQKIGGSFYRADKLAKEYQKAERESPLA